MLPFCSSYLLGYQHTLIPLVKDLVSGYYGRKKEEKIKEEHNQVRGSAQRLAFTGHAKLYYEKRRDTRRNYPLLTYIYNPLNKKLLLTNSLLEISWNDCNPLPSCLPEASAPTIHRHLLIYFYHILDPV